MFQSALFILLSVDQLSRHDDLAHYFTLSVAWLLHSCFFFLCPETCLKLPYPDSYILPWKADCHKGWQWIKN